MLELLDGFDAATVAVKTNGEVTRHDYEEVIIPHVKEILKTYDKVKFFMHMTEGTTYSAGAIATDTVFGLSHLFSWQRIAIVTDVDWMYKGAGFFMGLLPCEGKVYHEDKFDEAKAWIDSR